MLPRLETIKEERKKLNLTQKKLAVMTGVSTSMINQIESGRSKPSYDTAKKIFESLAKLEGQTSTHNAGDICSEKIVKLTLDSTIRDAGKKMHEKAIDQIPIFDGSTLKGLVTIDIVNEYSDRKDIKIKNVMNPKPPLIDASEPANALSQLIRISGCALVEKNSKIIGIITSADLLKTM